ncbi:RAP protein, putative [Plasmodium vinckei brucechwatti]|uniref:RAP protein, putative n=1 Tax=Plasmodium vinckei brucechwatti TaxID=119398 RepID=A0A6V7RT53_PLAVN|nr:RAP protein, putative [Plasmodium vinckei brucechwatti]
MFIKKYNNFFVKNGERITRTIILCNNLSSIRFFFSKSPYKNKKPLNIDYINKIRNNNEQDDEIKYNNIEGNNVCNQINKEHSYRHQFNCNREIYKKYGEDNKRITKICEELYENIKKKEYNDFENKLVYSISLAENAIEISQLINVISKSNFLKIPKGTKEYNNNNIDKDKIISSYVSLIDKSLKIFDNIPVRSISLILNSMVKLGIFHNNFIDLFIKNITKIVNQSNNIDLCIFYHFYINALDHVLILRENMEDILKLFLEKINNVSLELQIKSISSVLRCNKKLVKNIFPHNSTKVDTPKIREIQSSETNEINKTTTELKSQTNNSTLFSNKDNLKTINEINLNLKNNFYIKMNYGSIQQLCNILEDLEYFDLIDNDTYYDILNILKFPSNIYKLKNIDFINILNNIKSRNNKYKDLLPLSYFSFIFDILKEKDFSNCLTNDLAELIKLINYFKKMYNNLNFCMNKSEIILYKRDLADVLSIPTLIYILHDYSIINKRDTLLNSFTLKLFYRIMDCLNEDVINNSKFLKNVDEYLIKARNSESNKLFINSAEEKSNNILDLSTHLLLIKSVDMLIDKGVIKNNDYIFCKNFLYFNNYNKLGPSNYIKCEENEKCEKYVHYNLYIISIFSKIKHDDFNFLLYLIKNSLILSVYFSIKDIVILLKGLSKCSYLVDKINYLFFESILNYLSFLIIKKNDMNCSDLNWSNNNISIGISLFEKDLYFNKSIFKEQDILSITNNMYRQIENIIQTNSEYINTLHMSQLNENKLEYLPDSKLDRYENKIKFPIYGKEGEKEKNNIFVHNEKQMCYIDCCYILYYMDKLNYINYDIIKLVMKNMYVKINYLKNEHILKTINALTKIKNIDKEISSFNYFIKKLLFQFCYNIGDTNENSKNSNGVHKIEETIKMFYIISKLYTKNEYKNSLIRKYILILLEELLEKKNYPCINNALIIMKAFKNMYPYRYIKLAKCVIKWISDKIANYKISYIDHKICLKNNEEIFKNENDNLINFDFLKTYFSVLPTLVNPTTNIYSDINDEYLLTSKKLFSILHEQFRKNQSIKNDAISVIVDFMNFSFHYMDEFFLENYPNFILYIISEKDILSKDQFCLFLLNLKYLSNWGLKIKDNQVNDNIVGQEKYTELYNSIERSFNEFLNNDKNKSMIEIVYGDKPNYENNKLNYDFSFNKKRLTFLDTEDNDEQEIISMEYNSVNINDLFDIKKSNYNNELINKKEKKKNSYKFEENNERGKHKNRLNEFEIILRKYAYCQNNVQDKIEIVKNKRIFLFDIKYIDLKKNIIFDFLEEQDYFKEPDDSTIELLPHINLRLLILNKLNFYTLLMPFFEWDSYYGRLEKAKAIYHKLLSITNNTNSYPIQTNRDSVFSSIGQYK